MFPMTALTIRNHPLTGLTDRDDPLAGPAVGDDPLTVRECHGLRSQAVTGMGTGCQFVTPAKPVPVIAGYGL